MLMAGILVNLCAQTGDKAFEVPEYIIFNRKFFINLDNKNKLVIRLSDINDLERLTNLDSLLEVFFKDVAPLKDSLTDDLSAKRIDYVADAQNRKKIRLLQYPDKGSSFLVDQSGLSFGYLVHKSGEFFDENSFRLGAGQVQILKTTIEPCIYFNNLFKGVSPSIRISQSF